MCILGLNSFQGFDVTVLEGSPDDVGIRGNETCFPFFFGGKGNPGFVMP
jgi:hypothetical protein